MFVTTWVASAFAAGLIIIGLVGGDEAVLTRSIGPAAIALAGWAMMEVDRPSVAVQLFVGMAGLVFMVVTGDGNDILDALFGFMAMGVTGAVFVRRQVAVFIGTITVAIGVIGYLHGLAVDGALRMQTAFGSAVTYLFLAWLMVWLKGQWVESQQELRQLIQSKDELVASISHELRTPMTAVVGLARELNERFAEFRQSEVEEFISLIVDESSDVADILEDLLVAARADVGTLALDLRPVDLAEVIGTALAAAPDATMVCPAPLDSLEVLADAGRVRQIMRNLVVNAARYGGPNRRIVIRHRGQMAAISVCDDGQPIPHRDRARIFEAYRSQGYSSNVPGSVGLGLTISRELARLMAGDLTYSHDGSEGSFTLTLPLITAGPDRSEAEVEVTPLAM